MQTKKLRWGSKVSEAAGLCVPSRFRKKKRPNRMEALGVLSLVGPEWASELGGGQNADAPKL